MITLTFTIKALTKYKRLNMKRYACQKCSLFLRNRVGTWNHAHLFPARISNYSQLKILDKDFISKSNLVLHISSNSRNSFPIKCQTCHARLWKLLWGHQSRKLVVDLITLQHYEVPIILKLQACFFLYSIYRVIGLELMHDWMAFSSKANHF